MDEALGSTDYSYTSQRSRSRSPTRRRMSDDYNGGDRGSFDNNYGDQMRYPRRERGGFRGRGRGRGRGGRGGRGRGGFGSRDRYQGDRYQGDRYGEQPAPWRNAPRQESFSGPERNYDNSIFVGNLSFDCTTDDLRDFFSSIGEIVSSDIITSRGRHKGMGTVEFSNTTDVDSAIREFDGVTFMDRPIFVKQDHPPPGAIHDAPPPPEQRSFEERVGYGDAYNQSGYEYDSYNEQPSQGFEVFIINLPYSVNWQALKDLFRECGDVLRADVEMDYNGYSRGFGNVFYQTEEEMIRAVERFNGYNWDGRVLEVREGRSNRQSGRPLEVESQENIYEENIPESMEQPEEPIQRDIPVLSFTEGVIGGGEKNSLVYCSNLPFSTSLSDLYELFESLGKVNNAELNFDSNNTPTGIAVVEYNDISSAEICVNKLNNYNYGGNYLAVSYAQRTEQ